MPTQLAAAKASRITDEIRRVAEDERLEPEQVRSAVAAGHIVIPFNVNHPDQRPIGIGHGLSTKTNANMGTSSVQDDHDHEMAKLEAALEYGAESVMDLSTCEHCDGTRKMFIDASDVMVGTVPIYQAARKRAGSFLDMTADELFDAIEETARDGVDYITVHCGVTKRTVSAIDEAEKKRVCGIVSKGGSHHAAMIRATGEENPLYEQFDRLLEICREYDVTLSLGDGLRPGAIADATDSGQIEELLVIGGLQQRALAADVQAMIEGPGHVPLDQIKANVLIEKQICHGAPFYVLGPLTCDTAPGYDHITGAIGGAIAAAAGVDMLCYITPAEHLRLPTVEDVIDGVMATRIAAHSGDVVKGTGGAWQRNVEMSRARKALDWESMFALALDGKKPRRMREEMGEENLQVCSMCGDMCAINVDNASFRKFVEEKQTATL